MTESVSLVGKEISGCTILQKVAEGGMGAVYKARHKALNRIVCVKVLSPSLANDKKAVELFLTEARAIAELDHPNIVNVYNVGREQGYYFIVMSYIEGQTLSQIIKKHKQLPIGIILGLFEGVLSGLDAAHSKGIIHRDIKPSNILITQEGQPKIVDFGIAKKIGKDKTTTKTTELAGTAYFIAPEQALGKDLDTRADLYSVGASLFYVLTGRFPYSGRNTIEIIQKHINDPVPDPAIYRQDIPPWLSRAVQRLMAKQPDDRFQTAKEAFLFFQRMRAEEQRKIKESDGEKIVNLSEEGPLRLVKDEVFNTTTSIKMERAFQKQQPAAKVQRTSALPPLVQGNTVKEQRKKVWSQANSMPGLPTTDKAKTAKIYQAKAAPQLYKVRKLADTTIRFLMKLCVLPLLLGIIVAGIVFLFHSWGKVASVHTVSGVGLGQNLINSLFSQPYAPSQFHWMLLSLTSLLVVWLLNRVKSYSHSITFIVLTAVVAYLAGLCAPQIPLLHVSSVTRYIFSPEYNLAYLLLALLGSLVLCFTINRSMGQGVLGATLVVATLVLTYFSTRFSIPPTTLRPVALFPFLGMALGLGAISFFVTAQKKDSALGPALFLLGGVACLWIYGVSGIQETTLTTLTTLTQKVNIKQIAPPTDVQQAAQEEKRYNINSKRELFAPKNSTNELTHLSEDDSAKRIEREIIRVTGGQAFNERSLALFTHFLTTYYKGGYSPMKYKVWLYTMGLPFDNFNRNAQTNDVYSLLLIILFACSVGSCIGTIVLREKYE